MHSLPFNGRYRINADFFQIHFIYGIKESTKTFIRELKKDFLAWNGEKNPQLFLLSARQSFPAWSQTPNKINFFPNRRWPDNCVKPIRRIALNRELKTVRFKTISATSALIFMTQIKKFEVKFKAVVLLAWHYIIKVSSWVKTVQVISLIMSSVIFLTFLHFCLGSFASNM